MGPFDSRSVVGVTALLSLIAAIWALQTRRELSASERSVRIWAPGVVLMCLAAGLMGQYARWPEFLTTGIANAVLWIGMSLCAAGLNVFAGRKPPTRLLVSAGLLFMMLTACYLWAYPNYPFRLAINTVFILLFAALAFLAGADMQPRDAATKFLMSAYAALMVLCALRFLVVVSGLDSTTSLLDPNPMQTTFLIGYGIFCLLGNAAFLAALSERERAALRHAAAYDPLSGALNRGAVMAQLQREFKRAERAGHALSVLLIDIDHFKRVNDNFGHAAGDRAITGFAQRAMAQLRACDAFGRYGGEEFLAILPETGVPAAAQAAERLRESVLATGGDEPVYTVSIGVAALRPDMMLDALIQAADNALYRAKSNGRNRVEIADWAPPASRREEFA